MKTAVLIAGLITLFGIVGTPDYVLDVERENKSLRKKLAEAQAAALVCREAHPPVQYVQVSE